MRKKFSAGNPAWVSIIVVTELTWVLVRCYNYLRSHAADFLEGVVNTESLSAEDSFVVTEPPPPIFPTAPSSPGINPARYLQHKPSPVRPRSSMASSFSEASSEEAFASQRFGEFIILLDRFRPGLGRHQIPQSSPLSVPLPLRIASLFRRSLQFQWGDLCPMP